MRMIIGVVLSTIAALLVGCMPIAPIKPRSTDISLPLNAAAIQAALAPGHGIIKGQAFAKTVGGDVKYAAGNTIYLLPDDHGYASVCLVAISDLTHQPDCFARMEPYLRKTVADGQGNFAFDNVKPGAYIVETVITWGVPGPYGIEQTGGVVQGDTTIASDTDVVTVYLH